jgi:hypothetical protein
MSKILIIDKNINDVDIFINSLSDDVIYYYSSDIHDIIGDINNNIDDIYLGLVYHNTRNCNVVYFDFNNFMPAEFNLKRAERFKSMMNREFDTKSIDIKSTDIKSISNKDTTHRESYGVYKTFSYDFVNFIITLRRRCTRNLYVDFITCNIYADENYQHDVDKLAGDYGIICRYSTNDFGYHTGDYILEKPNIVDISRLYFTDKLSLWHHVLSGVGTEISKDQLYLYGIRYRNKRYKLTRNITLPNNVYIKIYNGETFDGNNKTITILGISYGFIYVDECSTTYPVIKNINVISTVGANGGGILQAFCNNFKVINCKHTGLLSGIHAGGICTQPISNFDPVNGLHWGFKVIKCEHDGDMVSYIVDNIFAMGGIIGGGFGNNISDINICINVYISKCVNNGNMLNDRAYYGTGSAGICGTHWYNGCFGNNNYCKFKCKISKCINNGIMYGYYNGGIIAGCNGYNSTNVINGSGCFGNNNYGILKCKIIDCINNGDITSTSYHNGGICSGGFIEINGFDNVVINGGGCFGNNNYGTIKCKIYKCINNGNITGYYNGGLFTEARHVIYVSNNTTINGGGCFGNNNYGNFKCKIHKCVNNGNIVGDHNSGLFSSSDNLILYTDNDIINGGGCFGNNNYGLFICKMYNCLNNGNMTGNFNGGICNSYANVIKSATNSIINGGGCFGNNNANSGNITIKIYNCINYGNIIGNVSGGLFNNSGNINYVTSINNINGGGCFGNNNSGIILCTLNKCINNGSIIGGLNGGICTGGCNWSNSIMPIGGGCFGNYNKHIMTVKILNCSNNAHIRGNDSCGLFSGIYAFYWEFIGSQQFCAGNYNSGILNIDVYNCNSKVNIIGESNGGIFNNNCGCYNLIQSNGLPSVLNFNIDSCKIDGFVVNLNSANSSGMLFCNNILSTNFNSINTFIINNCEFSAYIEGINCGIIAGTGINYSNDSSSINKLYIVNSKFNISNNACLFGGLLNVLSDENSQTIIKHVKIHVKHDIKNHIINNIYALMPLNNIVNTSNNITLKNINRKSNLLLQPNYLYTYIN